MPTYLLSNRDGVPHLFELKSEELQLAVASLRRNVQAETRYRRSFIRLYDGQDVVLRVEEPTPKEAA